jgi:hypothetical protein
VDFVKGRKENEGRKGKKKRKREGGREGEQR